MTVQKNKRVLRLKIYESLALHCSTTLKKGTKKGQAIYIAPLNPIPLLLSRPGGFSGSWSCRTYPSTKLRQIFDLTKLFTYFKIYSLKKRRVNHDTSLLFSNIIQSLSPYTNLSGCAIRVFYYIYTTLHLIKINYLTCN